MPLLSSFQTPPVPRAKQVLTTIYVAQVYLALLCRVEQLPRNLLGTQKTSSITIGKGKAKIMDQRDLMVCLNHLFNQIEYNHACSYFSFNNFHLQNTIITTQITYNTGLTTIFSLLHRSILVLLTILVTHTSNTILSTLLAIWATYTTNTTILYLE